MLITKQIKNLKSVIIKKYHVYSWNNFLAKKIKVVLMRSPSIYLDQLNRNKNYKQKMLWFSRCIAIPNILNQLIMLDW
jgi:hypothetical protein